jgi:hypothetical protein
VPEKVFEIVEVVVSTREELERFRAERGYDVVRAVPCGNSNDVRKAPETECQ